MSIEHFEFYRKPLAHQLRDFERFKDTSQFALFYEQRARKTKLILDIFRYRFLKSDVTALVVIAWPNGVHRVWIDELEKDFPPEFLKMVHATAWKSGHMGKTSAKEGLAKALIYSPTILTLNCEAILSKPTNLYLQKFFDKHKVMLVADESSWMANWSARTKRMLAYGKRSNIVIRAILDGAPVDEGPTDIYFPTMFLRKGILGFTSKVAFKNRYISYEMEETDQEIDGEIQTILQRVRKYNYKTETEYEIENGVQNLEELYDKIARFGSRVRRADVSDAPPKTYQMRYFKMTDRQRRIYDQLRDQYVMEFQQTTNVPITNVLKRMTRLQMIARNYHPPERGGAPCLACAGVGIKDDTECHVCEGFGIIVTDGKLERIDTRNPASEALQAELRATRAPTIVWCKHRQDVTDVIEAARLVGFNLFRYDGLVKPVEREANYLAFKAGQGDGIAGTISSGLTRGHDLTRAELLLYYSNSYALRDRSQSEDRAESLDRKISTGIVDLVAEDTRDQHTIEALRNKRSIAQRIMGDPIEAWI